MEIEVLETVDLQPDDGELSWGAIVKFPYVSMDMWVRIKINHQGTAGFSLFPFARVHFGYSFLTHTHVCPHFFSRVNWSKSG